MVYEKRTYGQLTFTPNHIFIFRIKSTKLCAYGINAVFFADGQMPLSSWMQMILLIQSYHPLQSQCYAQNNFTFGFIPYANVPFPGRNAADNQNRIIPPMTSIQATVFGVRFQIKHFQLVSFAISKQFAHIRTTEHAELMQCLLKIQTLQIQMGWGEIFFSSKKGQIRTVKSLLVLGSSSIIWTRCDKSNTRRFKITQKSFGLMWCKTSNSRKNILL